MDVLMRVCEPEGHQLPAVRGWAAFCETAREIAAAPQTHAGTPQFSSKAIADDDRDRY